MFRRNRLPYRRTPLPLDYTPEQPYPSNADVVPAPLMLATRATGAIMFAILAASLGASWYYSTDIQRQFEYLQRESDEMALRNRNRVRAVAVSPDGGTIACGVRGGAISLWNAHDGSALPVRMEQELGVRCLAFSPDGGLLAAGGGDSARGLGELRLWNWRTGNLLDGSTFSDAHIEAIAFSKAGDYLAASGSDGYLRVWRMPHFLPVARLKVSESPVTAVAFADDGSVLAAANDDGVVSFWSPGTWKQHAGFPAHEGVIWSLAFSPDSKWLASTGEGGAVRLWNVADPRESRALGRVVGHGRAVAFSPDGLTVAAAGGSVGCPGDLRSWNLERPEAMPPLPGHSDVIYALAWNSTGELVTGAADQTLRVWNPALQSLRLAIPIP
jgi:WD40 repeat protein